MMRNAIDILNDIERAEQESNESDIEISKLLDLVLDIEEKQEKMESDVHQISAINSKLDQLHLLIRHIALSAGYIRQNSEGRYVFVKTKER